MPLSQTQIGVVRRLIEAAPDAAVRTLETALAGSRNDNSIAAVHDLVNDELVERRVRGLVFAPISTLCGPPRLLSNLNFPAQVLPALWRVLKAEAPETVEAAVQAVITGRGAEDGPPLFDTLCALAAQGMDASEPAFQAAADLLESRSPGSAGVFVRVLKLAPYVRAAVPRLGGWVRNIGDEQGPAIRLAFRDATRDSDAATPIFMELLGSHMEEPWQVLRLISVMLDRPSDRYLASSELAGFGERILGEIDRRIAGVANFDPDQGWDEGAKAAAAVFTAVTMIGEVEQWLALSKDGPWGARIVGHRKTLAAAVETRLRETEQALATAAPANQSKHGGRSARLIPRLTADPDPKAIRRAQAYLGFLEGTRTSASNGGFGSLRLKLLEALEQRLDPYIEDVLDTLRAGGEGVPSARIRAYLDFAAQALGAIRNAEAADIVRRRMAAA